MALKKSNKPLEKSTDYTLELIAQGAESKLYLVDGKIIKHRLKKSYRIKEIDEPLRKHRTKSEASMLRRASNLINVPKIISVTDDKITMEYIDAPVLRDIMSIVSSEVLSKVGKTVAKLHENNLIHGDLTTSNMLVKDNRVFLIDFGLAEVKDSFEAKAVDLHLLKQAIESKHYNEYTHAWSLIKASYEKNYSKGALVIDRLKLVETRGRYKSKSL